MAYKSNAALAEHGDPETSSFTWARPITDGVEKGEDNKFDRLKTMAMQAIDHYRPFHAECEEMFGIYAGPGQWSEDDRKTLQRQLRVPVTFNRVGPVLDSLQGLEINNREKAAVFPRKQGNVKQSELYSAGLDYFRDKARAESEEADAFFDLGVCGMGWVDTYLKASERGRNTYDIGCDRVDPTEMSMDPASKKRNGRDARFVVRVRSIPIDAARELFDDCDDWEMHAGWAQVIDDGVDVSRLPETYLFNQPSSIRGPRTHVTIVEIQWWEYESYYEVMDPFTQQLTHMDKRTFDVAQRRYAMIAPGQKLAHAKYKRKCYKRAFLGAKVLAEPPLPCPYFFSYQCMTGKRDKKARHWFGLVRAMKDPQMYANKWLSQILHILNNNAKGGILASKATFEDWKSVQKNWSNPQFIAWLANGRKPEEVGYRQQAQIPPGLMELLQFGLNSVFDANGTSAELLGLAGRDQPGVLEYQRRQSGMTVLGVFFNALRMYRKDQGEMTLYMMQKWCADGRLVRVTIDSGEEQYAPLVLNQDEGIIEYDLAIDESPSSPNQKEAVWSLLVNAMPILGSLQLPPQVIIELLQYSPIPSSVLAKMRESMKPDQGAQAQQQQMQELMMALTKAQTKQLEGQAMESAADTVLKQSKAAVEQEKAQGEKLNNVITMTQAAQAATGGAPGPEKPTAPEKPQTSWSGPPQ